MTFITCDISGNRRVFDDDGLRLESRDIDSAIGQDASKEEPTYVGEIREILRVEPSA